MNRRDRGGLDVEVAMGVVGWRWRRGAGGVKLAVEVRWMRGWVGDGMEVDEGWGLGVGDWFSVEGWNFIFGQ